VRELRNVIEQTALFSPSEVVQASDIQLDLGLIERHRPHRRLGDAILARPEPVGGAQREQNSKPRSTRRSEVTSASSSIPPSSDARTGSIVGWRIVVMTGSARSA
jgi:DNA-binding NtrC family response regulator